MKILWKQLWHNHHVKIRFFMVGVWNTVFGYLVYLILDYIFTFVFQKRYSAYMAAAILGNIIATTNAFVFHKHITFQSSVKGKGIVKEYFKFYSTYTVANILGLGMLPFFAEILKIDPRLSYALIIPITTVFSYFGHSRFSFKSSA